MNIAVIFAGGSGKRMRSRDIPKQFLELHQKPIIIYTLELFEKHPDIDAIVIACKEDWIDYLNNLLYKYRIDKVKKVVPGGETGQMSIYNGLVAAREVAESQATSSTTPSGQATPTVVLIHDGVRPLINAQTITDNINSVKEHGSAITTAVVTETILVVDDSNEIKQVPDRSKSRVAKAPQSFLLDRVLAVHEKAQADGELNFIDTCTMMKHYGESLFLVDGPYENIKITTPDDFYTMRALLDARENEQLYVDKG